MSPRRAGCVVAAVGLALATSACRVDVSVGVDARDDGGGEVRATARLDGAAVAELGGAVPGAGIRLDDLRDAGWAIEGPTEQDDGGVEIVATHDFDSAEEAKALVADLGGEAGPLRAFSLRQRRTFLKTNTELRGTVDLRAGLGAFTDPDLQTALGATVDSPLGVTTAALERRLGADLERLFGLQVSVRLPGETTSNAPTETGGTAVWAPALGDEVVVEASSEQWNLGNVAGAAAAGASGLALIAVLATRARRHLTVTPGNITVGGDGETGEDRGGAPRQEG